MILYGAAGSGKTCFRNLLVGDPPPPVRVSTPLAVRPTALYRYEVGDGELRNLSLQERKDYLSRAIRAQAPKLQPPVDISSPPLIDDTGANTKAPNEASNTAPLQEERVASTATEASSSANVTSGESKEQEVSMLESITTDEELVALIEQSSSSKAIASYRMFQITDSGGQPQFHEMLPIFLRGVSYYIFVFKLSDELGSHPTVELYDEEGKLVGIPYTSAHSNEQLLQHCIQALQSHKSSKVDGERARILILGTHKDEESKCSTETREEKNEKIKKLLLPTFQNEALYSGVDWQPIFGVNAKSPADEDQKVAEQIRLLVMKDTSTKPAEIPLRWYALELLLEEMVARNLGRGVLSWKECLAAASSKLHFDEESLRAALVFLDGLSVVFHYKNILPKVVFANPQVVLDKASELVKAKHDLQRRCLMTHEWQRFHGNALVSLHFLSQEEFQKHYVPGLFSPADLVQLFRKLFIFADFNDVEFFVPALLDVLEEDEIDSHRVSLSSLLPPLVVEFPHKAPLLGVFCALTCFLLSERNCFPAPWCLSTSDVLKPTCLFRNCIQFDISQYHSSVVLIKSAKRFECHVSLPKAFFDRYAKNLCSFIWRALDKGLQEANTALGYSSSQYSTTLLCPCGEGRAHSAIVEDGLWICSASKEKSGELAPSQKIWLECSTDQGIILLILYQICYIIRLLNAQQLDKVNNVLLLHLSIE